MLPVFWKDEQIGQLAASGLPDMAWVYEYQPRSLPGMPRPAARKLRGRIEQSPGGQLRLVLAAGSAREDVAAIGRIHLFMPAAGFADLARGARRFPKAKP